jgi:hypothetical protein
MSRDNMVNRQVGLIPVILVVTMAGFMVCASYT